jgi:hypothetical protein
MDSGPPEIGLDADAAADMLAWETGGFWADAFRPHHAHRSRRAEQGPGPRPHRPLVTRHTLAEVPLTVLSFTA